METTVVDKVGSILITHGGEEYSLEKGGSIRIETDGDDIVFVQGDDPFMRIVFSAFTTPVFSSAKDGRSQIAAFLSTGGSSIITETASVTFDSETLQAPNETSAARDVTKYNRGTFQCIIANKQTNVVVRFQGTLTVNPTDSDWYNLDVNKVDTTYTEDGAFAAKYTGRHRFVRMLFVSESGGAAVTVAVILRLGN